MSASLSNAWAGFKKLVSDEPQQEPSLTDQLNNMCKLTLRTRILGFAITAGVGAAAVIVSAFFWFVPIAFALLYTFGVICFVSSTLFLVGPVRQFKMMFHPTRIIATIVFILAIGFTLFAALYVGSSLLVLLALIIQLAALAWYIITYIPGAQNCIKNAICGAVAV